ncbi:MAG: DUF21 domain-containing protein [Desulfobulbaceae bacterium]|jgi:CBS domain containing-hemolysin-like protein|nr:MAG: DUF21 domain-containing protein [Desulfobulbaceae bacterium]
MDIVILLLLVLLNGLFAMSEIALISSRNTRLQKLASEGNPGARSALQLKNEPSTFLSTVQVGITMVGILSGAIGEMAFIARHDGSWLVDGSAAIEHLKTRLGIHDPFPGEQENAYFTVGGLVIHMLGRIPVEADSFDDKGFHFEVVDMDGNRVDKILVSKKLEPTKIKLSNRQHTA